MSTAEEIVADIEDHVAVCGGDWWQWYVGIAADVEYRLFSDHRVCRDEDAWICVPARTSRTARKAEAYLIEEHGAQGGPGGGDANTRTVYAYRTADHTVE